MPECPFLQDRAARFEAARRDFESLVAGVSEAQANWRPSPERWSVAECIEHLSVSARQYFPKMRPAIERARERGTLGQAPFPRRSLLGRMLLWALDPKAVRKVRAPRVFRPERKEHDFGRVCQRMREDFDTFDELIEQADGLALDRIRLASPVAPFPRMVLSEAFELHAIHIPRHLAQARKVMAATGYPA